MVHIVEIQENRVQAGKEKPIKRKFTHALEITVFIEFAFGFVLLLIGLSGLPTHAEAAGSILSLGLAQVLLAIPGLIAIKFKQIRIWIVFAFLQFSIGLCHLAWLIVSATKGETWIAVMYGFLLVVQIWSAFAAIYNAKITSIKILIADIKGKPRDAKPFGSPQSRLEAGVLSSKKAGNSSVKTNAQSKATSQKKTQVSKNDSTKNGTSSSSKLKKPVASESIENAASSKKQPGSKEQLPSSLARKLDVKDDSKSAGAAAKVNPARIPRYYYLEHPDINSLSASSPENGSKKKSRNKAGKSERSVSMSKSSMTTMTPPPTVAKRDQMMRQSSWIPCQSTQKSASEALPSTNSTVALPSTTNNAAHQTTKAPAVVKPMEMVSTQQVSKTTPKSASKVHPSMVHVVVPQNAVKPMEYPALKNIDNSYNTTVNN